MQDSNAETTNPIDQFKSNITMMGLNSAGRTWVFNEANTIQTEFEYTSARAWKYGASDG